MTGLKDDTVRKQAQVGMGTVMPTVQVSENTETGHREEEWGSKIGSGDVGILLQG